MPVDGVDFRDLPKKRSCPDVDGIWLVEPHCQRIPCQLLDVKKNGNSPRELDTNVYIVEVGQMR